MSTHNRWRINRLSRLIALTGLVFAASTLPAAATHSNMSGTGTGGEGWELGPALDELCNVNGTEGAQFETTDYEISYVSGTYVVKNHDNSSTLANYSGPVDMEFHHGDMVAFPTHSEPGECADADGVRGGVPLTGASVTGSDGAGGSVACVMPSSVNGIYGRHNTDDFQIVVKLSCDIVENSIIKANDVLIKHTVTGNQVPCYQVSCSNTDAGSKLSSVAYGLSNP